MNNWEYETIPISQNLSCKPGLSLGATLAEYVKEIINSKAQEGWEYYKSDNYTLFQEPGCLGALFGEKARAAVYNLLVFRRPIQ